MQIKVLGPMTKQVEVLFQNAAVAAKKLKCPAKFERVSELRRIMAYGVMTLPALVIDGKVVAGGSDKNRKRNCKIAKFCKVRYNEIAKNAIFAISLFLYCRFTLICNLV